MSSLLAQLDAKQRQQLADLQRTQQTREVLLAQAAVRAAVGGGGAVTRTPGGELTAAAAGGAPAPAPTHGQPAAPLHVQQQQSHQLAQLQPRNVPPTSYTQWPMPSLKAEAGAAAQPSHPTTGWVLISSQYNVACVVGQVPHC